MLVQITQLSSSSPEAYTPTKDIACKVKQTAEEEIETRITNCKVPTYCTDLCRDQEERKCEDSEFNLYCYPLLILFSSFTTFDVIFLSNVFLTIDY